MVTHISASILNSKTRHKLITALWGKLKLHFCGFTSEALQLVFTKGNGKEDISGLGLKHYEVEIPLGQLEYKQFLYS